METQEQPGVNEILGSETPLIHPRSSLELIRVLRSRRFDLALMLSNSFRSAWIARWSGARRRVGYARDGRSWLLTDRVPVKNVRGGKRILAHARGPDRVRMGENLPVRLGRYEPMPLVEYYADLLESIGCPRPDHRLELFTTPVCEALVERRLRALNRKLPVEPLSLGKGEGRVRVLQADSMDAPKNLVAISPGAKYGAAKCWPVERFAELASSLVTERNADVLITCGPGEEPIARAIGERVRPAARERCHVLDTPRWSLGELKSLIRRCDLLVCNDAGPRHIAKAFNVPVVTIFGPTHPDWTWTDHANERIVRVDVDCGPCQQRTCPLGHLQCMTGVSVPAVLAAVDELLGRTVAAHA